MMLNEKQALLLIVMPSVCIALWLFLFVQLLLSSPVVNVWSLAFVCLAILLETKKDK